jgi:large subunit ribosomal protein L32
MAVPKKKTSKSKRNMRRASNGTYSPSNKNLPNFTEEPTTGELTLPHHISKDGYYKGRKVIKDKVKKEKKEEQKN